MHLNSRVFLTANLLLALSFSGTATQKQESAAGSEIPVAKLVNTVRFLNTQQMSYRDKNHQFASQDELLAFVREKNLLRKSAVDLDNPAPYQLQITTNPAATHYQISIQRLADSDDKSTSCHTAAFSDDRGLIFLGRAIDCPAAPH